jgi:AraC-like DNA-binding protein
MGGERTLDTARVPIPERFDYWSERVAEWFVPLRFERPDEDPFAGTVRAQAAGPLPIARIRSRAQRVQRTAPLDERRGGDVCYLVLQLSGAGRAAQDGRSAELRVGDFAIVDSTRPFELSFADDFQQMCATVPHDLLLPRLASPDATTAVRVRGDSGAGALAGRTLRAFAAQAGSLDREGARAASEHVVALLALALGRSAAAAGGAGRPALLQAAIEEMERRLGDPDLTPARVAAGISVSSRYLHLLFARRGTTFGRWLRERRLAGAHHELADPAWDHCSIASIAIRWGFRNPSHFARAFRARYGVPPVQHREARA